MKEQVQLNLFMKMENFIFRNEHWVQVEHPVTEVQTGIDIVKEIWIAYTGNTTNQKDIMPRGHSIEWDKC